MSQQEQTSHCGPKDTIPVKKAIHEARQWRQLFKRLFHTKKHPADHPILRAFYIPKKDLEEMLSRHDAVGARAYICVRDGIDDIRIDPFHIVLVPVRENENGHKIDILEFKDPESQEVVSAIYDFTSPCPSTCDENSLLY